MLKLWDLIMILFETENASFSQKRSLMQHIFYKFYENNFLHSLHVVSIRRSKKE
jgi:hypothetical protein